MEWSTDFVGLGTDERVPKYLRTNVKVKNRHLSKVRHCFYFYMKLAYSPALSWPKKSAVTPSICAHAIALCFA